MKRTPTNEEKEAILNAVFTPLDGKPPAERSGVAQPCPPSANGCPEARADGLPGADSSVRCPEVNGPAGKAKLSYEEWRALGPEKAAEYIARRNGYTAEKQGKLWAVLEWTWGESEPDAGQCNGQRVLPDNE